eukprot:gnl/Trimastix_PCT/1948.p1 GENE.gnl/Trimastix_PCT/1948~~gnl/Trimastix_PCT/1948.p1  ORF type:complete len:548 (-),score=159.46 gnl/Trimastix_PCT/1948:97-1740(-)
MEASPAPASRVFADIIFFRGQQGRFAIDGSGLHWKARKQDHPTSIGKSDIRSAKWVHIARAFRLELSLTVGSAAFDGFGSNDHDLIKNWLQEHCRVDMKTESVSTTGWNWGDLEVEPHAVTFSSNHRRAFELPTASISSSVISKNEVTLDFHQDEDANPEDDSLFQMRLYIPGEGGGRAQTFHDLVLEHADIHTATGDAIAVFNEVPLVVPRGRYQIEMYSTLMNLHGKTNDYKIPFKSISRLYLLPKPDKRHVAFVFSLDPPIQQGKTKYPHVIIQFPATDHIEIDINLTSEVIEERYPRLLRPTMEGPSYEIVSKVFRALTGRKITTPKTFRSAAKASAVKCSHRANEGFLYVLERSFFFIHKPALCIRFEDISGIEFSRVSSSATSSSSRTFDLTIWTRSGNKYEFTNISRSDYTPLHDFIRQKHLKVKSVQQEDSMVSTSRSDNGNDTHDPYLERVRRPEVQINDDDHSDDDDEDDEEYAAPENVEEVPEEYDEGYIPPEEEGDRTAPPKAKRPAPSAVHSTKKPHIEFDDDDDDSESDSQAG